MAPIMGAVAKRASGSEESGVGPEITEGGFKMPSSPGIRNAAALGRGVQNFGSVVRGQDTMAGLAGHAGSFVKKES